MRPLLGGSWWYVLAHNKNSQNNQSTYTNNLSASVQLAGRPAHLFGTRSLLGFPEMHVSAQPNVDRIID